jgi:hypothetical protein
MTSSTAPFAVNLRSSTFAEYSTFRSFCVSTPRAFTVFTDRIAPSSSFTVAGPASMDNVARLNFDQSSSHTCESASLYIAAPAWISIGLAESNHFNCTSFRMCSSRAVRVVLGAGGLPFAAIEPEGCWLLRPHLAALAFIRDAGRLNHHQLAGLLAGLYRGGLNAAGDLHIARRYEEAVRRVEIGFGALHFVEVLCVLREELERDSFQFDAVAIRTHSVVRGFDFVRGEPVPGRGMGPALVRTRTDTLGKGSGFLRRVSGLRGLANVVDVTNATKNQDDEE